MEHRRYVSRGMYRWGTNPTRLYSAGQHVESRGLDTDREENPAIDRIE